MPFAPSERDVREPFLWQEQLAHCISHDAIGQTSHNKVVVGSRVRVEIHLF